MLAPVGELLFVNLQIQFGDSRLQPLLHVRHGPVVDRGPDLFQDESEQRAGGDIADSLFHVLVEVALNGCDGGISHTAFKLNGHEASP